MDEAPTPPPPCPRCGGLMGDGDRVHYGTCGRCRARRGRLTRGPVVLW